MENDRVEKCIKELLLALGENPDREGLKDTPKRVAKMYQEILSGNSEDPDKNLELFFNELNSGDLVLVADIPFNSLCEHHLLPFFGKVHIAYIPNNSQILGLSKLARLVETLSKRLQVQERLTTQIGKSIISKLKSKGVFVIIEAVHMCMTIRGVKKIGTKTITTFSLGDFENNYALKNEVLSLIRGKS